LNSPKNNATVLNTTNYKLYYDTLENGKITDKSDEGYFAIGRHKKRKNILKIGIPVAALVTVLGIVFGIQVSEQGPMVMKMLMHVHPQLSVKVNGQPIIVPENVGIDKSLWKDHSLDKYGMQGMSPLHTHDSSGTIHVESSIERDYTLGEFLDVWDGLDTANDKTVKVIVNGQLLSDWRNHILEDKEQITLEIS
jgi:sulfur carrier protein ThiS